ncbi:N-acetylmuramoyl-L-alanine amidase family protein [Anaerosporobacter sp.]|uniref:N-acetylmuramoyl-L-alanine amidase family protein n=1 Tax=Anaerosporobacter sp. TaxID=1872529 RepID=UPI00286ED5B9|nr:N-acetylmuramoyl-L-alanine amidase [Anaerosporobacter sp.]
MKLKVCIDAGHGGKDPGAVKGKRYEKDDTLRFAKRLGKVLKANDVEVAYTRTEDVYDSPSEKASKGNSTKADLFVSIHRNAVENTSAHGTEVLVYSQNGIKNTIAKNICTGFKKLGFTDCGVKVDKKITVLNKTSMQAILVEVGFITNNDDNKLFDDKFYSAVNVGAREVCKAYGIDFKTITELGK